MQNEVTIALKAYLVIAAMFILSLWFHPYPLSYVIKPIPVLIMALLCFRYLEGPERYLMTLGFLFSGLGDVFLDLDRTAFFRQGLISFLVTQILFTLAFLRKRGALNASRIGAALLVIFYSTAMIILLWDHLDTLRIPVLIYILALTGMGVSGALRKGRLTDVYLGALLFVIADSLIAVNKFLSPFSGSLMIIIALYLLGQFFIGKGVLKPAD